MGPPIARLAAAKASVGVVLTLTDGRKVGGVWERDAFVSTYPAEGDLLVAVPCVLDQDTGRIRERVAGAKALHVKRNDILTLEVFDLDPLVEWGDDAGSREWHGDVDEE